MSPVRPLIILLWQPTNFPLSEEKKMEKINRSRIASITHFPFGCKNLRKLQFVLAMNPLLMQFVILFKALTGWIDFLLPPNVTIPFALLNKSYSGWISYIRQMASSSEITDQMTVECRQLQQEANQLRARLSEFQVLHESVVADRADTISIETRTRNSGESKHYGRN